MLVTEQFGDQPGLADAGLADHVDDVAVTVPGQGELITKDGELGVAADERDLEISACRCPPGAVVALLSADQSTRGWVRSCPSR